MAYRLEIPVNDLEFSTLPRLGELIGRGCEADVYSLSESMVFRAERVHPGRTTARALLALEAAHRGRVPVPKHARSMTVAGRPGIAMERLEPTNLLQHLGRWPWLVHSVGRFMGRTHAEMHRIPGPVDLPSLQEVAFNADRAELPKPPTTRRKDGKLLHGDFTPANLLRHPPSKRWVIVDWGGALSGDPEADVALTLVAISTGAPPETVSPLVRNLAPVGRRLLGSCYLREYLRYGGLDCGAVREWARFWRFQRRIGVTEEPSPAQHDPADAFL